MTQLMITTGTIGIALRKENRTTTLRGKKTRRVPQPHQSPLDFQFSTTLEMSNNESRESWQTKGGALGLEYLVSVRTCSLASLNGGLA